MSDKRFFSNQPHGCMALVARKPRAVVVGSGEFALTAAEEFRARGWDAFTVPPGNDLTCSVLARKPGAVILPVETAGESGFLIAAKLRKAKPKLKLVLVGAEKTDLAERFAHFVGASLVAEDEGVAGAVEAVMGM